MGTSKAEGKRSLKAMEEEEEDQDEDDNITGSHSGLMFVEDHEKIRKKGKRGFSTSSNTSGPNISCQVDDCGVDMTDAKHYHKRHKVCEFHAKSAIVCVSGLHQRFCQQCSRLCLNPNSSN